MRRNWLFFVYIAAWFFYTVFSFSLTDPNLVLTTWAPYWQFQQWMWHTVFVNAPLLTGLYIVLLAALFVLYFALISQPQATKKQVLILVSICIGVLLFSYNALSHDVFNYIFNAKMVAVYHANPHIAVALDFPRDPWTRFMHNTHTPAPYGYGWTALSLLPFTIGMGKFLPTWLVFRAFSIVSVILLYFALEFLTRRLYGKSLTAQQIVTVFLNPLFLIEMVSNAHNDLWMIVPALFAFGLITPSKKNQLNLVHGVLLLLLLLFSVSIKFATLTLFPLWIFLVLYQWQWVAHIWPKAQKWIVQNWPTIASLLLFVPLFTAQSQQFNPWYLVWVLVWLPFIQVKMWRQIILLFSVTSLLRYVPWLWNGGFSDAIVLQQKMITWSAVFFSLISAVPMFLQKKSPSVIFTEGGN